VASEAERREAAEDYEEYSNVSHGQRIGSASDSLDPDLVAQSH
jgi:hypothetical protein